MRENADFSTITRGEVFLLPEEPIAPIVWQGRSLRFIDQTRLPGDVDVVETADWRRVAEAIRRLEVRGAPLIGIAAAYGLALAAQAGEDVRAVAAALVATRPTAVNLRWAVERVLAGARTADAVAVAACAIHEEQRDADGRMAAIGAGLLPAGAVVLTHCNTGALATGATGTALGVIKSAYAQGRISRVLVDETRPLLQGARLTAWELGRAGVPYDIIADGAAAGCIARGGVQAVLVGADRIAGNGDTANKVGTYGLALAAAANDVPFYVVAPTSTIDSAAATGESIRVEERDADEVLEFHGVRVAPPDASALNPAFDVTPARYITAIITEAGVARPPYGAAIAALAREPAVAR